MQQDTRVSKILNILLNASDFVDVQTLMGLLNVSRRSVFNWIAEANDALTSQGLDLIENVSKVGYRLTDETREALNNQKIDMTQATSSGEVNISAEERLNRILLMLINGSSAVSINKLADRFDCSRNTIINDFKVLKAYLPSHSLENTSKGKRLELSENSLRMIVFEKLQIGSEIFKQWVTQNYSTDISKQVIVDLHAECDIKLTENSATMLLNFLKFDLGRIKANKVTESIQISMIDLGYVKTIVTFFETLLQTYFKTLSPTLVRQEALFLAKIVTCLPASKAGNINRESVLYHDMKQLSETMIRKYEQLTEEKIESDNFVSMLTNHLFSTYFRVKFGIPMVSREIEQIKKTYPKLIRFTAISASPFENYVKTKLPENEVALICLYFGSAEHRKVNSEWKLETGKIEDAISKDVLIVCSSGIGTSVMLLHQLAAMFPMIQFSQPLEIQDLNRIMDKQNVAKAVVTTVPLEQDSLTIPIIVVKPVLTSSDYEHVEVTLKKTFPPSFHEQREEY